MRFNDWINSIAESGLELLRNQRKSLIKGQSPDIEQLCDSLLSNKGEALGTALAGEVIQAYKTMCVNDKASFFNMLLDKYNPDPKIIIDYANDYLAQQNRDNLKKLSAAVESPRQNLIRRINMAPGGTETVVDMRCELLKIVNQRADLKIVDDDLVHLLTSWFSPGFLELKQIDWNTSANLLEKLISYEAVHEIQGWEDLRRRLDSDRRCFAFFHPALANEPIIFVEVALVNGISDSIQEILSLNEETIHSTIPDTAIFYSISNCQTGLKGINFGNFLIKQVVTLLKEELPQIKQYVTLSPIPGFADWILSLSDSECPEILSTDDLARITESNNNEDLLANTLSVPSEKLLMPLCAHYLYHSKHNKKPADPVARFHLANGASILRLNWQADTSTQGLKQSFGILVNYQYDLDTVTINHELFVNNGEITISNEFSDILH